MTVSERDERYHPDALEEEWSFAWWSRDEGGFTSYRLRRDATAWYCWAWWRRGRPLLHVVEFDVIRRADPMIAKAEAMWAEFTCESPLRQWTLGNETHAVELDDPGEALGRVRGTLVPMASDLEWYAEGAPESRADGYTQRGVIVGDVETDEGPVAIVETASVRAHRWSDRPLDHEWIPLVTAHLGPRLPFAYPDGRVLDLVLTPNGWCRRGG